MSDIFARGVLEGFLGPGKVILNDYSLSVVDIDGGHQLVISRGNDVQTLDIMDGAAGFSPVVEVTEIEGGHRVTVTDANGSQSFDVMNGKDGEGGGGNVEIDLATDEEVLLLLMEEDALNVPTDSDGTIIADKNGVVLMN